ncbi:hypothetical protein D3C81_967220 [compost metagenome]
MRRATGDPRRGRHTEDHRTRRWRLKLRLREHFRRGFGHHGQCLDVLAQPRFNRRQQGRQRIGGHIRLSNDFQHLAAPGTEAQQLAQALGRNGRLAAVDHTQTNFTVKRLGQLRQLLGRPRMQAMGIGQADARTGPIRRHFTAQHFEHRAAIGGAAQFLAAAFDQQRAQALKQSLMGFAQASEAEHPVQRLVAITQRLLWGDKGQPGLTHGLLAVQPPQAFAQRQRLDLLQHPGKTSADTIGAVQQTRRAPDQLVEIFGRHAQADHLRIQRQLLRRALQQLEQCLGRTGPTQRLGQVGFTQSAGQQLQQAQVFIGACGDTDGQVHLMAIAPVHTLGELQQTHAGGKHLIAGFRGAMGDRNTLAQKGRTLRLAGLQASQVAVGNQAIADQVLGHKLQRRRLIHSRLAHGYLLYSELEHDLLLCSTRRVLRYCCEFFSIGPVAISPRQAVVRQKNRLLKRLIWNCEHVTR